MDIEFIKVQQVTLHRVQERDNVFDPPKVAGLAYERMNLTTLANQDSRHVGANEARGSGDEYPNAVIFNRLNAFGD